MIEFYLPKYEDLWFRRQFLQDEETMSYNLAWGGTIDFSEEKWADWYGRWVLHADGKRFYRYLRDAESGEFVGEAAFYFDGEIWMTNIIVYSKCRGRGFGTEGLLLLCRAAKEAGIKCLWDDIAIENPSVHMFIKAGFTEVFRTEEAVRLKKLL